MNVSGFHRQNLIDGNAAVSLKIGGVGELGVFICVAVRGELMDMAHRSERLASNMTKVQAFLDNIDVSLIE